MVAIFFLRPNSLTFSPTHLFLFHKPCLLKPTIVSLFSTTTKAIITPKTLPYGPSLQKGKTPSQYPQQKQQLYQFQSDSGLLLHCGDEQENEKQEDPFDNEEDKIINEKNFTRVFDIAALRVPAKDCFALESRIRGHLLNWPRIRNIARVPGDEVEKEIVFLLGENESGSGDEEGNFYALQRRVYGKAEGDGERLSPVLYREKLAKQFNSRGFVKFRNLAKISRPKRKRKYGKGEEKEGNGRNGRDGFAVVDVVEEEEEEEGDGWKGLLGDEFKGRRKWKGSTRLLLLDEKYTEKGMEDLPQAIKVAIQNSFVAL